MNPFLGAGWTLQVERGNHEALLNAGQSYSSMWKRQAAGIMEDPDSPREEDRCRKMSILDGVWIDVS